jgi:hypothetical protein
MNYAQLGSIDLVYAEAERCNSAYNDLASLGKECPKTQRVTILALGAIDDWDGQ